MGAALRVYKIRRNAYAVLPIAFSRESAFQKLLLNFTWWVNRKDAEGLNLFQGGFLGLDNIGVFDRSAPLPYRRISGATGRDELDGDVLPEYVGDRRWNWRAKIWPTRMWRANSSNTSCTSRKR